MVLGDALRGIADEAQPLRRQIAEPAEIVVDRAGLGVGIERVDREVAPRRVLAPVERKGDGRAAAVGRDVAAQRGHLEPAALGDGGDGAMVDAGRHRLQTRRLQPRDHLFGQQRGGQVDVLHRAAEQAVAHRAADDARTCLAIAQRGDHGPQRGIAAPVGFGQRHCYHISLRDRLAMIPAVTPQMRRPCQSMS